MKSISSWAASLEDKILGALWSLLQNMLIPIMSGLSAVLFIICIFQAISSYQSGDQVSTRRNSLKDGEIKCIAAAVKRHCLVLAGKERYAIEVGTLPYEEHLFGKGGGQ